jgi:hypothetical protein
MKVKYVGGFDAVTVPLPSGGEVECERGGVIDVPDGFGASLLEQEANWQPVAVVKKPGKPADGGDD